MASIFTKIINGEIPCHKISEDENFIAFLDIRPQTKGHTLVVPKVEEDYIFDQPDHILENMLVFSRPIAKAIEKSVTCQRVGLAVVGLEVPHTHLHLIPISEISDLGFGRPLDMNQDELAELAKVIKSHL
jgi:histidine triad (HIT) family protein